MSLAGDDLSFFVNDLQVVRVAWSPPTPWTMETLSAQIFATHEALGGCTLTFFWRDDDDNDTLIDNDADLQIALCAHATKGVFTYGFHVMTDFDHSTMSKASSSCLPLLGKKRREKCVLTRKKIKQLSGQKVNVLSFILLLVR